MAPILLADLDRMAEIVRTLGMDPGGAWGEFQGRTLDLPAWFDRTLDARSDAYREQQFRLWRVICGTSEAYDPLRDEQAPEIAELDAIRFPAFYARRDGAAIDSAGDHVIAMGHLLKRCGLVAGDWALEYGAGFGQTALTLARLGVNVDTIDVNPAFGRAVEAQARHFGVPLTPFPGVFGDNPRHDARYALVLFYESFHHCADYRTLIHQLHTMLREGGRVLLAGEPILAAPHPAIPYPWGVRLDSETVAVMRWRHWLELGYQESFIVRAFIEAGFVWQKHPCAITHYAEVHEFRRRPRHVVMGSYGLPLDDEAGWHPPEPTGRWTRGRATLPVDASAPGLTLTVGNYHPTPVELVVDSTGQQTRHILPPLQTTSIPIPGPTPAITLDSPATTPIAYGGADPRPLGVFLHGFEYADS